MSALQFILKMEGLRCPCCRYQLRTGPRYFRYKAKVREQKQVEVKALYYYPQPNV